MTEGELVPIDVSEPKKPLPKPTLPAYNGFGSLEDSLQNCVKLVGVAWPARRACCSALHHCGTVLRPKLKGSPACLAYGCELGALQVPTAPKRDLVALMNKDRIVLRFKCKLAEDSGYRLTNIDR